MTNPLNHVEPTTDYRVYVNRFNGEPYAIENLTQDQAILVKDVVANEQLKDYTVSMNMITIEHYEEDPDDETKMGWFTAYDDETGESLDDEDSKATFNDVEDDED